MNLKLKKTNSSKYKSRYSKSLEKQIERYSDEEAVNGNAPTRDEITALLLEKLSKEKFNSYKAGISSKTVRILKKYMANILADGGLQKINPTKLSQYLTSMNYFFAMNWNQSCHYYEIWELNDMYEAILKKELDTYAKEANFQSSGNDDKKECLFQLLLFFVEGDTIPDSLLEILNKEFDIDIIGGKNVDQIPQWLITKATYSLEKLYLYESVTPELQEHGEKIFKLIYNYIENISQTTDPEMILMKAPIIMEFYNIANSYRGEVNKAEYPPEEIINMSKKILSMVPSHIPVTEEEISFMDSCCKEYMDKVMPEDVTKKYVQIYLKLLTNKVAQPNIPEAMPIEYVDILLGQFLLENPNFMEGQHVPSGLNPLNIVRLAVYDFAKELANIYAPTFNVRISMAKEFDNTGYFGFHDPDRKTIDIITFLKQIDDIYTAIRGIYHENKHSAVDYNYENAIYRYPLEYVGNKVLTMRDIFPYIVINGGLNYKNSSYEVDARMIEYKGLESFVHRHGVDNIDEGILKQIEKLKKRDLKYIKKFDVLLNPYFQGYAKRSREDDFLTFKDGYMVNVNKAFDAFIQKHLELCAPGKYFSIEYNPDGKRKPLSQILSEMGQLDESPESDDLRSVYQYIIQERSYKK